MGKGIQKMGNRKDRKLTLAVKKKLAELKKKADKKREYEKKRNR